ncbi:MAG: hypothetical protein V3W31_10000 [Thermodesulfobacteriota bacterium]
MNGNNINRFKLSAIIVLFPLVVVYILLDLFFSNFSPWDKWLQIGIIYTLILNTKYYAGVLYHAFTGDSSGKKRVQIGLGFPLLFALLAGAFYLNIRGIHWGHHIIIVMVGALFAYCDYSIATINPNSHNNDLLKTYYNFDIPIAASLFIVVAFYFIAPLMQIDKNEVGAFVSGAIAFQMLFATFTFNEDALPNYSKGD